MIDSENKLLIDYIKNNTNYTIYYMSLKTIMRKRIQYTDPSFIVGNITFVNAYLKRVYEIEHHDVDYPTCLSDYLYRDIWIDTYENARTLSNSRSIFIKPFIKAKQFTGKVINRGENKVKCRYTDLIYISSVTNFVSEYRYFIVDHKIMDCRLYSDSDNDLKCDDNVVLEMVKAIEESDCIKGNSYLLDVGVLYSGETALVEINSGYSFGTYGCNLKHAVQILENTFHAITT